MERPRSSTPAPVVGRAAAISLRDVVKRFPVRRGWVDTLRHPLRREWAPVVQSVSCDIEPGEFFGVLGPNGAGKTTLFRMIASTVLPDSGSIHVSGYDVVNQARAARRILTVVPSEERSLSWRLSAQENLYLFGRLHRLSGAPLRRKVDELLEVVELADVGTKMVAKFSSGMKQRLMIARALLGGPRILLLDEPTRALDPLSARRLREFLRTELVERHGCTVVLATHNGEEALELCNRVAILDRGRLLAVGRPSALITELQGERYQVWTQAPDHPAWDAMLQAGVLMTLERGAADAAGWVPVTVSFIGGGDEAARVLANLVGAGVPVSRFVPQQMNLADLIETVVRQSAAEGGHV